MQAFRKSKIVLDSFCYFRLNTLFLHINPYIYKYTFMSNSFSYMVIYAYNFTKLQEMDSQVQVFAILSWKSFSNK